MSCRPPWRVDMHRQVDLIEEVGRHHGFEHLPSTFPASSRRRRRPIRASRAIAARARRCSAWASPRRSRSRSSKRRPREPFLNGAGAGRTRESAVGNIRRDAAEPAARPDRRAQPQPPARPRRRAALRDRHALLAERRNARRRRSPGRASATADHWSGARRPVDFSDIKGVVEQLARWRIRSTPTFTETDAAYPGRRPRRRDRRQRQHDRRASANSRRRSPKRAICRPRMRSTSAKSISTR